MSLAIIDSIICCNGEIVSKDVMEKFYNWYNKGEYSSNGRCFDIGYATVKALESWKFKIYQNQSESKGNGSIMRIAPTVALDFIDKNYDYKHSLKVSNLTHKNLYVQYVVKQMCDVMFEHFEGKKTQKQSIFFARFPFRLSFFFKNFNHIINEIINKIFFYDIIFPAVRNYIISII